MYSTYQGKLHEQPYWKQLFTLLLLFRNLFSAVIKTPAFMFITSVLCICAKFVAIGLSSVLSRSKQTNHKKHYDNPNHCVNVSFIARLTSFIFQQKRTGFRDELRKISVPEIFQAIALLGVSPRTVLSAVAIVYGK